MDNRNLSGFPATAVLPQIERAAHFRRGFAMTVAPTPQPGAKRGDVVMGRVAPVNLTAALQRIGYDHSLLRDLAQFFIEDVPALLAELEASIPQGASAEVERAAHSVKGLAGNFDAHAVKSCAQKLEEAGHTANLDGARALLDELTREVRIVTDILHREVLTQPA